MRRNIISDANNSGISISTISLLCTASCVSNYCYDTDKYDILEKAKKSYLEYGYYVERGYYIELYSVNKSVATYDNILYPLTISSNARLYEQNINRCISSRRASYDNIRNSINNLSNRNI
jgi:hypothetical protein